MELQTVQTPFSLHEHEVLLLNSALTVSALRWRSRSLHVKSWSSVANWVPKAVWPLPSSFQASWTGTTVCAGVGAGAMLTSTRIDVDLDTVRSHLTFVFPLTAIIHRLWLLVTGVWRYLRLWLVKGPRRSFPRLSTAKLWSSLPRPRTRLTASEGVRPVDGHRPT